MLSVAKWITVLVCFIVLGIAAEGFILGTDVMYQNYGINTVLLSGLGIAAEVIFDLSLVGLAITCSKQIVWKEIRSFNFESLRKVRVKGLLMNGLLLINAVGWLMPFAYCLIAGFGKLPWVVEGALLAEIIIHLLTCAYVKGWLIPSKTTNLN